jgi:hypothetical protein
MLTVGAQRYYQSSPVWIPHHQEWRRDLRRKLTAPAPTVKESLTVQISAIGEQIAKVLSSRMARRLHFTLNHFLAKVDFQSGRVA